MTINANFFRFDLLLKDGLTYLERNPGVHDADHHAAALAEARDRLKQALGEADRVFFTYRQAHQQAILANKVLRAQCDRASRLCEQWGVRGLVDVRVPYLEPDSIQALAREVIGFLEERESPGKWVTGTVSAIREALERARAAAAEEDRTLAEFRSRVIDSQAGFEGAREAYRSFFNELKGELGRNHSAILQLDPSLR